MNTRIAVSWGSKNVDIWNDGDTGTEKQAWVVDDEDCLDDWEKLPTLIVITISCSKTLTFHVVLFFCHC